MSRVLDTQAADADLLADFKRTRAQETFARLVARHQPMVYRTCLRLLGNQQDAEDATQSTFLVLSRNAERVDRLLTPWLHKVARNIAIQLLRSRTRRNKREQLVARSEAAGELRPENISEDLDQALSKLPADQREAVILRYIEGRSQDEAAALVGCPRGTLSQRASRGLEKLRDILARRGVLTPAVLAAWLQQEATATAASASAATSAQLAATVVQGSVGGQAASLADGFAKLLFWTKVKTVAAAGAIALAAAVTLPLVLAPTATTIRAHAGVIPTAAFSPDGQWFVTGGQDGHVKIWDAHTLELHKDLEVSAGGIEAVCFAPDGRLAIADGYRKGRLMLFNGAGATEWSQQGEFSVSAIAFSPNGRWLVTTDRGGHTIVYDLAAGTPRRVIDLDGNSVNGVAFTPDSNSLVVKRFQQNYIVDVYEAGTWRRRWQHTDPAVWGASNTVFLDGGKQVAAWTMVNRRERSGKILVWDVQTGRVVRELAVGTIFVRWLDATPDERYLVLGRGTVVEQAQNAIELWDRQADRRVAALPGHGLGPLSLFNPDGRSVLICHGNGELERRPLSELLDPR